MLDAKINELKRTVEPRELELGALKSQVSSVDDELQEYNDTNAALDVRIGALRKDIDLLLAESAAARVTLTQRTRSLEAFEKELYVSVQAAGSDPRAHVLAALRLASAHGSTAPGGVSSDVDLAYIAESLRQQEHLSNVATTLRARVHAASIGRQSGSGRSSLKTARSSRRSDRYGMPLPPCGGKCARFGLGRASDGRMRMREIMISPPH